MDPRITFYADPELKALVHRWAKEDDRSVSNVIRRCIERERQRREDGIPADGNNGKAKDQVLIAST